jgi:hypothetical protein
MTHQQSKQTLLETRTTLPPAEVLESAKRFFARRNSIYSAFLEKEGPTYVNLRGQGGEEVIIAAHPVDGATLVTGSSYIFDQQIARFFSTLAPAGETSQGREKPGAAGEPKPAITPDSAAGTTKPGGAK